VVLSGISIGRFCVPVKLWLVPECPSFFAEGLDRKNQRCEDGFITERKMKDE